MKNLLKGKMTSVLLNTKKAWFW